MRGRGGKLRMTIFCKRHHAFGLALLIILSLVMAGCATAPSEPMPTYKREAVHLTLTASEQVNLYGGLPHATVLCVYQLSNPNVYQQMLEEVEGVDKLLSCENFDASVKSRRRIVVQPGDRKVVVMDRAEGARYLAIVAGYYKRAPGSFSRLVPFPVVETGGFSKRKELGEIQLDIELGSEGIIKP